MLKTSRDHCKLSFSSVFVKVHPRRPRTSYIQFLNLFLWQIWESEFHITLISLPIQKYTRRNDHNGDKPCRGKFVQPRFDCLSCHCSATLCSVQAPSTIGRNESCLIETTSCYSCSLFEGEVKLTKIILRLIYDSVNPR